jgi:hypothetical protein
VTTARTFGLLVRKELDELFASRALLLLFVISSILTGHAFIDALQFYAEASGSGGGPSALAQSLSPLDGIVVPVFGALDLTATLVFPFVVIRLFAAERETGELLLSLQMRGGGWLAGAAKAVALYVAWVVSLVPAGIALSLWSMHGGHLAGGETAVVVAGYLVRGGLTIGVGAAACGVTASASTAAIVALTFTLGTWMLDYAAAAKGGVMAVLATYTPEAALRTFERGELRVATVAILCTLAALGIVLWAIAMQTGRSRAWRWRVAAGAIAGATVVCAASTAIRASRDVSEDRRNSFAPADERALSGITGLLRVTVFLSAEDPRLTDLERGVLFKLRRTVPHVSVQYAATSRSGLFEAAGSHYGEIRYELNGRTAVTRSVAEPVVLETLYELLRVSPPVAEPSAYPGYPARITSAIAPWLFFALIPLVVMLVWWRLRARVVDFPTVLT